MAKRWKMDGKILWHEDSQKTLLFVGPSLLKGQAEITTKLFLMYMHKRGQVLHLLILLVMKLKYDNRYSSMVDFVAVENCHYIIRVLQVKRLTLAKRLQTLRRN